MRYQVYTLALDVDCHGIDLFLECVVGRLKRAELRRISTNKPPIESIMAADLFPFELAPIEGALDRENVGETAIIALGPFMFVLLCVY